MMNVPVSTQSNEILYKTINYKNNKIPNKLMNQKLSSNFINFSLKNKNSDEDDTKDNLNFKIFMKNLFSKDEENNNEISSIRSNKIFFERQKKKSTDIIMNYNSKENYNKYLTSRNYKSPKNSTKKSFTMDNNMYNNMEDLKFNEIDKRSIGSECNINSNFFMEKKIRNCRNLTFGREKDILAFSFQEFNGKMLSLIRERNNYFQNIEKIKKKAKKTNSYNLAKKIIPKNLIPKIMFQSSNIIKKEKENKMKLLTIKENAILFLKEKNNKSNRHIEKQKSIFSYAYTNEKINFSLNKKYKNHISNLPLAKRKMIGNNKNLIKYFHGLRIKDRFILNLKELNKKAQYDNDKLIYKRKIYS